MISLFQPAAAVLAALAPHPVYAVGGVVRAWVLGQPIEGLEIDLCTPLLPEQTLALAKKAGLKVGTRGAQWGCIAVDGFEVTSFRTETYTAGSRHPTVAFGVDVTRDAARRDFTANAMYLDKNGTLTDPYNGASHLKAGRMVWVENPAQKLAEDPIRWWRWLRFSAMYGVAGLQNPSWASVGGAEHAADMVALAHVVLQHQNAASAARWHAEAQKAAGVKGAAAVRTVLMNSLAPLGERAESLLP